MDTGYERQLAARARELAELDDARDQALTCLGGARHAGLDPEALAGLVGCAAALGATSTATYTAGTGWTGRHPGERAFLAHITSIEDDIEEHIHAARQLSQQATGAASAAHSDLNDACDDLDDAHRQLATARATPVHRPCDGCHHARRAAIAAAESAITEAQQDTRTCHERIALSGQVIEQTIHLVQRLEWALTRIRAVPEDLGETYQSVYNLIRRGGALPHDGRWITGG